MRESGSPRAGGVVEGARGGTPRTRRQVLRITGTSFGLVLAGSLTSCRLRWDDGSTQQPPAPTADQTGRNLAAQGVRHLLDLTTAVQALRPDATASLAIVTDLHRHHLVALGEPPPPLITAGATPSSGAGGTPGGHRSPTTSAGSPPAKRGTPAATPASTNRATTTTLTKSTALATLAGAERAEAVRIRTDLPELSGEVARTLASIAACCDVLGDLVLSTGTSRTAS